MRPADVMAVVVSYNGGEKTYKTVDLLRRQVGSVYVVDNGSDSSSLSVLDAVERANAAVVQRLGENRGLGHALNLGVRRAREMGYSWLLTMDQDSEVDDSIILAYQAALIADPSRVCLAPTIVNSTRSRGRRNSSVPYAITSGNLVRLTVFDQVGLYDEGFFIDCIDFDFSLRVRHAGLAVVRVSDAFMRHQLGEATTANGTFSKYYARHSPVRRYYMYRNFMYLAERYFREFPTFVAKLGLAHIVLAFLIAFHDLHPLDSYRAIARGIADYVARKDGPLMS